MPGAARHIVLVGPMASGKSTVGAALAARLGMAFVDVDARIVAEHGAIAGIFESEGEEGFRRIESRVLLAALDGPPAVVATGGGVVLGAANREALRGHRVVWLDVSARTAGRRLAADGSRPLLAGTDPLGAWARIAGQRAPLYDEVATARVDADDDGPEAVAGSVLLALRGTDEEMA